jgi:hypothetical protein
VGFVVFGGKLNVAKALFLGQKSADLQHCQNVHCAAFCLRDAG